MQNPTPFGPLSIGDFRKRMAEDGPTATAIALCAKAEASAADNVFIALDKAAFDLVAKARPATGDRVATGPLDGIPFVVKDNIDAIPFATTGGTPQLADHCPESDAPAVAILRKAGAIPVGKTNLHELAFGITNNNSHFGAVRNPFNRDHIAGGSSGGTAAAIALGIVPFGLGTDTGGSVRIPAAFCGIVGFRPTTGRYPAGGVLTLSPTRDTIGVMAASVPDILLADAELTGDSSAHHPARPLRLGILANARAGLSNAVDDAVNRSLAAFEKAGIELVPVDSSELEALDRQIAHPIALAETRIAWEQFANEKLGISLGEFAAGVASADVREIFRDLATADEAGAEYADAIKRGRPRLQSIYAGLFADYEVAALVTSTVPVPPPLIGEDMIMASDDNRLPTFPTVTAHTSPATVAGVPSLSIPAGLGANGLPVGLMLEGPAGSDRLLLAVGAALETILSPFGPGDAQ